MTCALVQTGYRNIDVVFLPRDFYHSQFVHGDFVKVGGVAFLIIHLATPVNRPNAVILNLINFKNDTVWLHITVKACAEIL